MKRTLVLTRPVRLRARKVALRRQALGFAGVYAILAALIALLMGLRGMLQLTALIGVGVALLAVLVARGWSSAFEGWALHVDEGAIYLTGNPEETAIHREDIRSVTESANGLVVKGGSPPHRIWVPAGIEHYAELKRTLEGWLEEQRQPA